MKRKLATVGAATLLAAGLTAATAATASAVSCPPPSGSATETSTQTFGNFVDQHVFPVNGTPNVANVANATVCAEGTLTNAQYDLINSAGQGDGWDETPAQLGDGAVKWYFYGPG